jgi:hypothetical protein
MVVAVAALGWTVSERLRDVWWGDQPNVAHQPNDEGWAAIDDRSLRLISLSEITDPPPDELTGESRVRPGLSIWRAEVEADAAGEPKTCAGELEDASGHRYNGESPQVPSFDDETYSIECGGGDVPVSVAYFLLPEDAEPVAVRVTSLTTNPDYWLLPAG